MTTSDMLNMINLKLNVKQNEVLADIDEPPERLNIDDIYSKVVGAHGLWQIIIVLIICLSTSSTIQFPIYSNAVPKFRCKMENFVEEYFSITEFNITINEKRRLTFHEIAQIIGPWSSDENDEGLHRGFYGCNRYQFNHTSYLIRADIPFTVNKQQTEIPTERCSNGYVYDSWGYQFPDTIVAEWDLVCDDSWKVPFSTSIFMIGMMIGFVFGGFVGDILGRRNSIYIASVFEFAFGQAVSFSPNFVVYTAMRALLSAAVTVKVVSISVFLVEMTNARYRSMFSAGWSLYFTFVSRSVHALIAMFLPDWRNLHRVIMIPSFFGLVLFYFMPESPRWLLSQGRNKDAAFTLYKAYKINMRFKKTETILLSESEFFEAINFKPILDKCSDKQRSFFKELLNFCNINLFSSFIRAIGRPYQSKNIAKLSLISTCLFTGQLCCFFGLLYYTQVVRGSIYFMSFINALMSLPGTFISTIIYTKVKSRKTPLIILYILTSIILLIGGIYTVVVKPDSELCLMLCSNFGLMLSGATFNMIFIYIPELFPSIIRTQCLGYAAGFSRVGSIVSSFINELDMTLGHGVPVIIYGSVLILQVLWICLAPNTSGVNLADVIEKKKERTIINAEH